MAYSYISAKSSGDVALSSDFNQLMDNLSALKGGSVTAAPLSDIATLAGSEALVGEVISYGGTDTPSGCLTCDGSAISRGTYSTLWSVVAENKSTCTITIAAPGVVTNTGHGLVTGDLIYFTTTGALPTGLVANTEYFVIYAGINSFTLATSLALALVGTEITTSGSQSGVHTLFHAPWGIGDGTTTFNIPDAVGLVAKGHGTGSVGGNSKVGPVFGAVQEDATQKVTGNAGARFAYISAESGADLGDGAFSSVSGPVTGDYNTRTGGAGFELRFDNSLSTSPNTSRTTDLQTQENTFGVKYCIRYQ